MKETNTKDFPDSGNVYFWQKQIPVLDVILATRNYFSIDVRKNPDIIGTKKIVEIPTIVTYSNGRETERFQGIQGVKKFLSNHP
jgi:hypothetical protein